MGATAEQYLRQLDTGRRPDLPETTAGTLRLDVRDDGSTDHWHLTIADQRVRVTRSADDAELVVRADRAVFDRMARGELHPGAGLLRNELTVQGNMQLLMLLRRIFSGPYGARHPHELGRAALVGRAATTARNERS
ncbi:MULTISPECIES: SCP2 sterol-binding domain-containing protein [Micromonospora]|uniref:SCP2 sterol-binding domain-containing protein n=1 Tax=Micromonospora TaxID=1873 RepID=UPI001EE82409|nr:MULTISPECIES: SCP2 sterol-binding domain-containing protein [Micromonospora]MCG5452051.1 SCP2 sterol-binding domain-containing protein [Micromonospora hortensis]MCX5117681.1 SCP2 sterol-binding domain-containing protein [Micromonospora sp. NBC_00362]